MEVATARARLDEPVVLLADLIRGEPLTAGESVQLADALLTAPHGRSQLSVRSVVVTESGSIRLLEPVPDLQACGRLVARAMGVALGPRSQLAAVERAAPALVACIRSLAAGKYATAEEAMQAVTEAAGAAALEPARIRARQRLRLRARQARPIVPAVDGVMKPAPPPLERRLVDSSSTHAPSKRRLVDRWRGWPRLRRPAPLTAAVFSTVVLVALLIGVGARLPVGPSPPRGSSPEQSVRMVFDLGAQRRYDEAAALRTARLQAADPVARSFRERFGKDGVTLVQDRLVALDPVHGRATVAVVWTERAGGQTQRLSGQVFLVSSRSGWRWDGASFE